MGCVPPLPPNPFRRDNSWFQPGMTVPRSGLYQVHHDAHRQAHAVMAVAGNKFPSCRHCGDRVQFAPLFAGEPIETDHDLAMSDSTAA
jgi:hypothetical protein